MVKRSKKPIKKGTKRRTTKAKKTYKKKAVKKAPAKKVPKKKTPKRAAKKVTRKVAAKPRRSKVKQTRFHTNVKDLTHRYTCTDEKWVIVELQEDCSLEENHEAVERQMFLCLGKDAKCFLPVYTEQVKSKSVAVSLFDGYAFVKQTEEVLTRLSRIRSEYVCGPLAGKGGYQTVGTEVINDLKHKLEKEVRGMVPRKGQKVIPRVGVFQNLTGKVISVDKRRLLAQVLFERSSRVVRAPINVINLIPA